MKIAIVHEWFVSHAGSEKVVEQILNIFPEADLFSLIDFLPEGSRDFIQNKKVKTTFIQKLPKSKTSYRNYFPFFSLAVEQHDLSNYDLIISSSHCAAKGVLTGPDQLHICYCHSPVRYAWDLQHQYLNESGLNTGIKGWMVKYLLHKFRIWDYRTANGVDHFIANSDYIGRRIKKVYGRESTTIYPNVDVDAFELCENKDDFYLTCSRMVPYKKIDLIVEAFNNMPDRQLVVIGDGPDFVKISRIAGKNIQILGHQPFYVLKEKMQQAKAFVYAAEEDFGIVPVEAQACGTPVIAFAKGGLRETVIDGQTGVFFDQQCPISLQKAVINFEETSSLVAPVDIRNHALQFSTERFKREFELFVKEQMLNHLNSIKGKPLAK